MQRRSGCGVRNRTRALVDLFSPRSATAEANYRMMMIVAMSQVCFFVPPTLPTMWRTAESLTRGNRIGSEFKKGGVAKVVIYSYSTASSQTACYNG